jgi:hypothetical protein
MRKLIKWSSWLIFSLRWFWLLVLFHLLSLIFPVEYFAEICFNFADCCLRLGLLIPTMLFKISAMKLLALIFLKIRLFSRGLLAQRFGLRCGWIERLQIVEKCLYILNMFLRDGQSILLTFGHKFGIRKFKPLVHLLLLFHTKLFEHAINWRSCWTLIQSLVERVVFELSQIIEQSFYVIIRFVRYLNFQFSTLKN